MGKSVVLVIGGDGFIGSQYVATSHHRLTVPPENKLDITNPKHLSSYFKQHKIDLVVNFAAMTDLDKAERERNNLAGLAWKVNVVGVKNLVDICKVFNIFLIQISTDAVFSCKRSDPGPYSESHPTYTREKELSWYGWTKRQAEELIRENLKRYSIVRISWPVGKAHFPTRDYIQKLLVRIEQRGLIALFTDQYITLTYIPELATALDIVIDQKLPGIFHVSSRNRCTPYQVAHYITKRLGINHPLSKSSLSDYKKTAQFPNRYYQFSGLLTSKTSSLLNLKFRTWKEIVDEIISKGLLPFPTN